MRRRLSVICSAISLALCLIAGSWWVRSYFTLDEWSAVDDANVLRGVLSFHGGIHLVRAERNSTARPLAWDAYAVPDGAGYGEVYTSGTLDGRLLGLMRVSGEPIKATIGANGQVTYAPPRAGPPFGFSPVGQRPLTPWLLTVPFRAWIVPYWAVVLVLSVAPARLTFRLVRERRRRRAGRCTACGYDLRASAGRCPECGTVAPG